MTDNELRLKLLNLIEDVKKDQKYSGSRAEDSYNAGLLYAYTVCLHLVERQAHAPAESVTDSPTAAWLDAREAEALESMGDTH